MSCKCNGISMCEGRRSFAPMPAIVICDNRHAIDPRPLTRAQIAAIPGVKYPAAKTKPKPAKPTVANGDYVSFTTSEQACAIRLWHGKMRICDIAIELEREPTSVRAMLMRCGIDTAARGRKAKSIAAKRREAA